jgi:DNA-binding response OmpR family regulator
VLAAGSPISLLFLGENRASTERLSRLLESENIDLTVVVDVYEGQRLFTKKKFHVVVIELFDVAGPGLDFCRWVRNQSIVPIIALTSRESEITEEIALAIGADDYVVQPPHEKILKSRIAQQIEISKRTTSSPSQLLLHENISLDLITHIFRVGEVQVPLTATEYLIMQLFMKQAERVFTREQILETMGIGEGPGTDHIINSHISRLRIKVRNNGGPEVITVIRNMGYKFIAEKRSYNFKLVNDGKKAKSFTLIPSHEESDS